jgi:hypothetical protein
LISIFLRCSPPVPTASWVSCHSRRSPTAAQPSKSVALPETPIDVTVPDAGERKD